MINLINLILCLYYSLFGFPESLGNRWEIWKWKKLLAVSFLENMKMWAYKLNLFIISFTLVNFASVASVIYFVYLLESSLKGSSLERFPSLSKQKVVKFSHFLWMDLIHIQFGVYTYEWPQ